MRFKQIVINKLDALTLNRPKSNEDLKICVAYKANDGTILKDVPRSEKIHKTLFPVYETMSGWEEDLTNSVF